LQPFLIPLTGVTPPPPPSPLGISPPPPPFLVGDAILLSIPILFPKNCSQIVPSFLVSKLRFVFCSPWLWPPPVSFFLTLLGGSSYFPEGFPQAAFDYLEVGRRVVYPPPLSPGLRIPPRLCFFPIFRRSFMVRYGCPTPLLQAPLCDDSECYSGLSIRSPAKPSPFPRPTVFSCAPQQHPFHLHGRDFLFFLYFLFPPSKASLPFLVHMGVSPPSCI